MLAHTEAIIWKEAQEVQMQHVEHTSPSQTTKEVSELVNHLSSDLDLPWCAKLRSVSEYEL